MRTPDEYEPLDAMTVSVYEALYISAKSGLDGAQRARKWNIALLVFYSVIFVLIFVLAIFSENWWSWINVVLFALCAGLFYWLSFVRYPQIIARWQNAVGNASIALKAATETARNRAL